MLKRNSYELAENIWLLEIKQGSISETLFSVTRDGLVTFGKAKNTICSKVVNLMTRLVLNDL